MLASPPLSRFYIYGKKRQRKSCFGASLGNVLMFRILRGNDAKSPRRELRHPRAMQLPPPPHTLFSGLLTSSYSTCTLEKITGTGKRSSTRPASTPSVRLSPPSPLSLVAPKWKSRGAHSMPARPERFRAKHLLSSDQLP